MMVVSVAGFIATLVLNAFFLDKYNAYGEVPIPGSSRVHLPAGEVTISLHAVVIGGPNGGGLPVPPLGRDDQTARRGGAAGGDGKHRQHNDGQQRRARAGVGGADSRRRHLQHHDGRQVNGYITPRLAFGHSSSYGFLVWVFVGDFRCGPCYFDSSLEVAGPHSAKGGGVGVMPPPAFQSFPQVDVQPSYRGPSAQ